MRNLKNIVAIALFSLPCLSCSDILDKGPLDKYSENDVWTNPDLAQAFIYTTLKNTTDMLILKDQFTDNNTIQEDSEASNFNKEQIDRYYDVDWAKWNKYEDIRRCNMILAKVPDAPFLDKEKEYFTAQAKAMRGIMYFSRARLFGKLMIVDRLIDPDEDMAFPRTATIKDTYDFILKDLQDAAPYLPETLSGKQGMLTKGAVYAMIAEVALHGAAYIETGKEAYYDIAQKASEDLFNLGVYELDADYQKMFNDFDYSLNSKEIILAQWKHADNTKFADTWMQSLVPNTDNNKNIETARPQLLEEFAGWPLSFPSVDLVNAYEVVDTDGKAVDWNQSSYYKNYRQNGGYVSDALYTNRDKRFYASIAYDSTAYFRNTITTRVGGNVHWKSNIYGDWGMTKTGYLFRKCVYESKRLLNTEPTSYHYVLLRLGRSYLNYAEVMLRKGNISTAIEYINKTRVSHGGLPELPRTLAVDAAWNAYKRERRVDLLMEGDRYWSLLRWGKADNLSTIKELTITHQALEIAADGKSFEIIPLPFKVSDNERAFTKKRYLLPVPQKERDLNPALDQNPDW